MRVAERATPVAAMIAVLSTLACCLPFTFLGSAPEQGGAQGASLLALIAPNVQLNEPDAEQDRCAQYWDDDHLIARELQQQLPSEPSCCQRNGVLWDVAVLYGKQAQCGNSSPLFADGPVVKAAPDLAKLASLQMAGKPN
jgi:hypothetical protein